MKPSDPGDKCYKQASSWASLMGLPADRGACGKGQTDGMPVVARPEVGTFDPYVYIHEIMR